MSDTTGERLVERLEEAVGDTTDLGHRYNSDPVVREKILRIIQTGIDAIAEIRRLREAEERMTKWRAETFDEMVRYREALERFEPWMVTWLRGNVNCVPDYVRSADGGLTTAYTVNNWIATIIHAILTAQEADHE